MNETVSVIVPVYNAQRFLKKCITSIIMQTYTDLQIILVDDGSTDKSLTICNKFAAEDNRILVLRQNNRGVSAARNYGLDHVVGKYVTFVDSDDWLPRDGIKKLFDGLHASNSQFVVGNMYRLFPLRSSPEDFETLQISKRNPSSDDTEMFFSYMGYYAHVAKKLLLTRIIGEYSIRFPETIRCGEDSCFMLDYLSHCERVASIKDVVYYNTRLYDNTGGTRYYPERHIWANEVLSKYKAVVRGYLPIEKADNLVSREAISSINKTCHRHEENAESVNESARMVEETYSLLEPYVMKGYHPKPNDEPAFTEFTERKRNMYNTNQNMNSAQKVRITTWGGGTETYH